MLQMTDSVFDWDQLQEPMCSSGHSPGYLRLMAALDCGWNIHLVDRRTARQKSEPCKLYFILARVGSDEIRALLLSCHRDLEQFLRDEHPMYAF